MRLIKIKNVLIVLFVIALNQGNTQVQSVLCSGAENVCGSNGSSFSLGTGANGLISGNNISNPQSNPQGVNSGCSFSNGVYPNWFIINIGTSGNLEFAVGAAGGSGFFDWVLWPYDANACAGISGNTLPPVACNWNASAGGFTGMWNGVPPGGNAGNFQPSIPVTAGQQFLLMFSNYSALSGNTQLSFPTNPGSAGVSCTSGTPDQTICEGTTATVSLSINPNIASPTVNWLVTNNVSDVNGITNVLVNPTVTTTYQVEVLELGLPIDTISFTITVVPLPVPNAGIDDTVCLGQPIFLNGTVGSATNTISWQPITTGIIPVPVVSFAPNFSSLTPTVTVNQIGLYQFVLRESNATCGIVRDTVRVLVSQISQTTSSVSPSCFGAADGEIHITSLFADEYSFDNGVTWQIDSFAVVFTAGTYSVCSRNAMGCQICSNVTVTNPALVTISVSNDTLICQNGTASLLASATGGTSYLYHWDQTASTGAAQAVSPLVNTTYSVFAENQNGCVSATETINVTVRAALTGTVSPIITICPGYPTTLTATANGGIGSPFTFTWSSGEIGNGPSHTITAGPAITSHYIITVNDGCESTPLVLNTDVIVAPLPVPLISVDDDSKCEPANFVLVNETDPTMVDLVYWELSDGQVFLDVDTIRPENMMSNLYDVQLVITSPQGCVDSTTFYNYLTVYPKPIANFNHSPNPVFMYNPEVQLTNYSSNAVTYNWFIESGNPSYSELTHVRTLFPDGVEGQYHVMLIATSEFGCIDTTEQIVIVLPEVIIYVPNTFTPDDDEFNQSWGIYIEGIDIYDFELLIYNRWGQIIWESHDPSAKWDGTYSGKHVENGTYTWIIRTKDIVNDAKYVFNGHVNILR